MTKTLWQSSAIVLLTAAAVAFCAAAYAQNQPAKPAKPAQAKPAQPAQKKPHKSDPTEQAVLLGQFGDWGAYKASPGGKKVCFALSKPTATVTEPANKKRDPSYAFVSTRPSQACPPVGPTSLLPSVASSRKCSVKVGTACR